MTNHRTIHKAAGLDERELERVRGGYLSIELENTLISSLKDDSKPQPGAPSAVSTTGKYGSANAG